MVNVEMSHVDLECGGGGGHRRSSVASDSGSVCLSDADEGSCDSQFYSTHDGSGSGSYDGRSFACGSDPENGGASDSESDCSVDIENGVGEIKARLGKVERDCRICHLGLESGTNNSAECGIAIELGCSCKDDLAVAHKHCAEVWFKIKGNKTCEICNSVARNVFATNEIESTHEVNEASATTTNAVPSAPETRSSCFNGHRILNFLLACMVFAFVISWLFHFNVPS